MKLNCKKYIKNTIDTIFLEVATLVIFIGLTTASADMPTSQFLLVGQGARSEAMGEATVADCFDHTATFWNPAGMSFARNPEIGFNSVPLPGSIMVNDVDFIYPGKKLSFGFRVITMASEMDAVDSNGNVLPQNLNENDNNEDVFASYKLLNCFAIGVGAGTTSMKYVVPGITYSASTTNGNIGAVYFKNDISIAASLNNIGSNIKLTDDSQGEPQPEIIRLGIAYRTLDGKNLILAAAAEDSTFDKNASGLRIGSEYAFSQNFALRGGFIIENNGDSRPTLGLGVYYLGFGLDISSTISPASMEDINVLRFSLSYKFSSNE